MGVDAGSGKIETTADVECVGLDAGAGAITTTAGVTCVGLNAGAGAIQTTGTVTSASLDAGTGQIATTGNVTCTGVAASGDVSCVGVAASAGVGAASLTTTGDINSGAGNIISGGTISGSSISTSSGSITSAGDIVATSGTGFIHGKSILSDTNISCGAGGNYFVGSSQIASSNLLDGSLLLNTSSTAQSKVGALTASNLTATSNVACGAGGNFLVGASQIASSNLSDASTLLNTSATLQTKT